MPVINPDQQKMLAEIRAKNQAVLATTQWQWAQMANSLSGGGASAAFALGSNFQFNLANTSGYLRRIRIWFQDVTITNSNGSTAGKLNRNGFYQLLGSLTVSLGNNIYRVPGGAMALLWQTYSRFGNLASYRGNQSYGYSPDLFSANATVAASGSTAYTGYIEIPFAALDCVYDPDGMAPTLANTGMQVAFTTPATGALQGADCLISPFGTAGTLALSGSTPGTITIWAEMARQVSVASNGSLNPFVVGTAFVFEDVPQVFQTGPSFYTFQGQDSALILVKSIVVIDSPGELVNEYSDPSNLIRMDLMYDQQSPVFLNQASTTPFFGASGGLANWMVDSGQAIGDQPPGVYVFDFGRGTDADYPNSSVYMNLEQFSKAGLTIQYAVAPQTASNIHFLNQYLVPNFYKALKG